MREETESQQEDSPESAWLSYHRSVLPCTERDCANVCACMSECMCMQMHRCAGCTYVHAHIQMRVHVDPWAAGRLWGGALSMGGAAGCTPLSRAWRHLPSGLTFRSRGCEACGAGWSQRGRKSPSGRGVLAPRSHRPRWRRTGRGGFVSSSRGLCPMSHHPTAHQDTGLLCDPDICSTQRCVCVPVSVHTCACREHAVGTHVHAMGMQGRGALCAGSWESSRGSGPCSCDGHNGPAGWWRARAL